MRSNRFGVILAALLFVSGCAESAAPLDSADEIMALEREWSDRFQKKDIDWIAELHCDDARQVPPGAPPVVGAEAIRTAWQTMADTEGLTLKWEPIFAKVSGDLAYDVGKGVLTTPDGNAQPMNYVGVWERCDGQWKVAVDMFGPDQ